MDLLKIKLFSTRVTSAASTDQGAAPQPQRQARRWRDKATNVGGSVATKGSGSVATKGSIAQTRHAPRGGEAAAAALKDEDAP